MRVGGGKWQPSREDTNGANSVPIENHKTCKTKGRSSFIPDSKEFDVDVNAEGLLEFGTLLPSDFVLPRVHAIRKGDLLVIAAWQKADL